MADAALTHRYQDIANRLYADIRDGVYPPGSRLPTEHTIARDHKVSRHTVRHAMQELVRLGMVSRRRGAGTVVVKTEPRPNFLNSIGNVGDLLQYAAVTRLEIRRVRPALALPAIDGPPPQRRPDEWTHVEGIRYMDGLDEPLCWTDIFLHPDISDVAAEVGQAPTAVYRMIEDRHDLMVRSITQQIDAVNIGGDLAAALRTRGGSPALKITRAYHDIADRVVEIAVNIHPAGRFSYRMTILRDSEGSGAG